MSHIISAWVYIADSGQENLIGGSFYVLSDIIRNIIDGWYSDEYIHCDSISFHDPKTPSVKTSIRGISIWDGEIHIYNRSDVEKNIRWRKWKIEVLYQLDGQLLTLDLGTIQSIVQEKVHRFTQPEDMIGALIESNRNFQVQVSPESGLLVSVH